MVVLTAAIQNTSVHMKTKRVSTIPSHNHLLRSQIMLIYANNVNILLNSVTHKHMKIKVNNSQGITAGIGRRDIH